MAVIVSFAYAGILWTLRHGYGWGDEAFIDTMIATNRMAIGEAWGFQHLLHPLYTVTGESFLIFRVLRLVGYVTTSVGLVWSARLMMRRMGFSIPRSGWVFILLLAQAGTFLVWSEPVRSLGYNELASWFTQLGVALILLSLTWREPLPHHGRSSRVPWAIWAGLGGLTILLGFAKVTSAVAFGAVLALALVVPNPSLRLWKRVVSLTAGAASVLLLLWVGRVPVGFYLKNAYLLVFDKSAREAFGHPGAVMFTTYADSLLFTGRALLPAVLLFALAMASFGRNTPSVGDGSRAGAIDWVTWTLGVLLVIALVALPRVDVWSYVGEVAVFIGAAGFIGLAIVGVDRVARLRPAVSRLFPVAVGGVAVMAAPFIAAVGTTNRLAGQLVFAATLWSVVLGIALVLLAQRATRLRSRARALPLILGCVVLLLAALAVRADIAKPYQNAPLLSQQTSTSVPALRGLLLTETDAAWADWLAAAGDSLHARGVPAIAIDSSGAVLAFNGSSYGNPWLGKDWLAAYRSLSLACRTHPPTDLFVLQPGDSTPHASSTSGVTKSLAACGISFPGDFQRVAHTGSANPQRVMTIWRLRYGWRGARRDALVR